METIKDVINENLETFAIRYNKNGKNFILVLEVNEDNCLVYSTIDSFRNKTKIYTFFEGLLEDFCYENKAIEYGILNPEIALLNFYNNINHNKPII